MGLEGPAPGVEVDAVVVIVRGEDASLRKSIDGVHYCRYAVAALITTLAFLLSTMTMTLLAESRDAATPPPPNLTASLAARTPRHSQLSRTRRP